MVGKSEMNPTVSDKNDPAAARQLHFAHRRIEGREHLIHGQHAGPGDAIEERGFSSVGVADDGDDRVRHLAPAGPVQLARAHDVRQILLQSEDALLDHAPVEFELGFAGAAEEAAAAALALQVRPRTNEASLLIRQMRQFDL